ncbi:hypothetical protein [Amycolatopsis sp. FDAARGOS 1241]|uniref:hypothetical protein n=1 Tax=Amycolatopsis sp. FDAARGOS 1241 TaxID=2778070 RepID=UPI00194DC53E|nr:hypothetical protein [Amycolatopsis sp. FDAARGOS 1241]QRP44186.1 hypothetical protein I6J71_33565 [Amycolatopsis sp. FDAARGOS 1241]
MIPLVALALAVLARHYPALSSDIVRRRLVWTATLGYTGLPALVTWQAPRGQPIVRPEFWALAAAAGLLVVVASGVKVSLRSDRFLRTLR